MKLNKIEQMLLFFLNSQEGVTEIQKYEYACDAMKHFMMRATFGINRTKEKDIRLSKNWENVRKELSKELNNHF